MSDYSKLKKEELLKLKEQFSEDFEKVKAKGLKLDMSRGKPNKIQLDLSNELNDILKSDSDYKCESGIDVRNYGVLDGIPECKRLFGEILGVDDSNIIIFGASSLTIMYDYIAQCMIFGAGGKPWSAQENVTFLCPAPGYDRHFGILQHFGIKMINIPMNNDGPDMDKIEELVKNSNVKGVICVPKYTNPEGITFSDEVVRRFAALKPAAEDFRVIWDNAYVVHDFNDTPDSLLNIFDVAKEYGNEDLFIEVTSTSKITFPGAGVSALAASDKNIAAIKKRMTIQIIGHDKINQLRHARYLKNLSNVKEHMKKHAEIIRPKFETVLNAFSNELDGLGIARWTTPNGGYFISLYVMAGTAQKVGALCKEAGVTLTKVGATYPYGIDPDDSNIRIAPTFPDVDELEAAVEILCLCIKLAAVEKLLETAE
ncbi:MAG: aminotransferase class I/II-fold pyridoxal phosphate-dependent enzyme [Clostridia bacterium]|nr:aminotransferase class I/II-fold pyridoxal phosphate-dependent enzyme [Clostridia bacterium]